MVNLFVSQQRKKLRFLSSMMKMNEKSEQDADDIGHRCGSVLEDNTSVSSAAVLAGRMLSGVMQMRGSPSFPGSIEIQEDIVRGTIVP